MIGSAAEILEQNDAGGQIDSVDFRRGESSAAQTAVDRDIGFKPFGEAGDRAVGLAVADRRTIGLLRRDHQDRAGAVVLDQTLERSGRGVALHELTLCVAPARRLEKILNSLRSARAGRRRRRNR